MIELFLLIHSWYPTECCSQKDCSEVRVEAAAGGWQVIDGPLIPYGRERESPDGKFHLCIYNKQVRCFFAPGFGA